MKRSATAVWNGTGKEGTGHLSTQSGVLSRANYAWNTRFAEEKGTNPEELIAAAHSGCFTMKLSFVLTDAGFPPESLETTSTVTLENGIISSSHLEVKGRVPGISEEKFQQCVSDAKVNCPVSKALNMNITAGATLI